MLEYGQFVHPLLHYYNEQKIFSLILFTFYRVNGTQSVLDYVPRTEMDYGNVMCWATNSVGRQEKPCVFHIIPAGKRTFLCGNIKYIYVMAMDDFKNVHIEGGPDQTFSKYSFTTKKCTQEQQMLATARQCIILTYLYI